MGIKEANAVEVVQAMFRALQCRDQPAWESVVSEQAVLNVPYLPEGTQRRYEGRAAFTDLTWGFFRQWDTFQWLDMDLHSALDDPGLVFGTGRSRAESAGKGLLYENQYCFVARVEDGKVVRYDEYFNPQNVAKTFSDPLGKS